MTERDFMMPADSSAKNCYYGRHVPPQPVSLLPPPAPNYPIPPGPIKVEDPPAMDYPLFPDWQPKDEIKDEEVHEESFETKVPPATLAPAPSSASTAQPLTTTISNEIAAIPVKSEHNAEENRNLTKCLHCNIDFSSEASLGHHVLIVHGTATSVRLCHLCTDVSAGMHDELFREMHMHLKHGLETFRCSLCGFIEYEMGKIAQHLASSHTDIGPLNLRQFLNYIERPLCKCYVESCLKYFNLSKTIPGKEHGTQNQSMARSTGSESRDIRGSGRSSSDEMNLLLPSSRSSNLQNVNVLTLNKSKNVGALTPASLVSLISSKSLTNSTQDNPIDLSCTRSSVIAHTRQITATPIENTARENTSSPLRIAKNIRNEISTSVPKNCQFFCASRSDSEGSTSANPVESLDESRQFRVSKTFNNGMHSHVNTNMPSCHSTSNQDCKVQTNVYFSSKHCNTNIDIHTKNPSASLINNINSKGSISNTKLNTNFRKEPAKAHINTHSSAQALLSSISRTTYLNRVEGNISSKCNPHDKFKLLGPIYGDAGARQYPNFSCQQNQNVIGAPFFNQPIQGVESYQTFQNKAMHTNSQTPQRIENHKTTYPRNAVLDLSRKSIVTNTISLANQFPCPQTTNYNSANNGNAIDQVAKMSSQSQGPSFCPMIVDNTRESAISNDKRLAKENAAPQTTSHRSSNKSSTKGRAAKLSSQSQRPSVHHLQEHASSIRPGFHAGASALPCPTTTVASKTVMQMPPRGIMSGKGRLEQYCQRTMALEPQLKRTRDGDGEYPDHPPQQKRRRSPSQTTESEVFTNNDVEIVHLEINKTTGGFPPGRITDRCAAGIIKRSQNKTRKEQDPEKTLSPDTAYVLASEITPGITHLSIDTNTTCSTGSTNQTDINTVVIPFNIINPLSNHNNIKDGEDTSIHLNTAVLYEEGSDQDVHCYKTSARYISGGDELRKINGYDDVGDQGNIDDNKILNSEDKSIISFIEDDILCNSGNISNLCYIKDDGVLTIEDKSIVSLNEDDILCSSGSISNHCNINDNGVLTIEDEPIVSLNEDDIRCNSSNISNLCNINDNGVLTMEDEPIVSSNEDDILCSSGNITNHSIINDNGVLTMEDEPIVSSNEDDILCSSGNITNHGIINDNGVLTIEDEPIVSSNEDDILCSSGNITNHSIINDNGVLTMEDEPIVSPNEDDILCSSGNITNHGIINDNGVLTIDDESIISFSEDNVMCSSAYLELENSNSSVIGDTATVLNTGFRYVDEDCPEIQRGNANNGSCSENDLEHSLEHSIGEGQNPRNNDVSVGVNNNDVNAQGDTSESFSHSRDGNVSLNESKSLQVDENLILIQEKRLFKGRKISRDYECRENNFILPSEFLMENKDELKQKLRSLLSNNKITRVQIVVEYNLIKYNVDGTSNVSNQIISTMFHATNYQDIEATFNTLLEEIQNKFNNNTVEESGWAIRDTKRICLVFIDMYRTFKTKVGTYVPYPKHFPGRNNVVNINGGKRDDCLELHLIASTMNEQTRPLTNKFRAKFYRTRKDAINIPNNVTYPTAMEDIVKYETINNIAVNVYRLKMLRGSKTQYKLGLVRLSCFNKKIGVRTVSLLRLNKKHLCLIKDLNKYMSLLCKNSSSIIRSTFFCNVCLRGFVNEGLKAQHEGNCFEKSYQQRIVYPEKGNVRKFTNYGGMTSPYFSAVFDSESLLVKTDRASSKNTDMDNEHRLTSYCYMITDRQGKIVKQKMERSNSDTLVEHFLNSIMKDWEDLKNSLVTYKTPVLTPEDEKKFRAATHCQMCKVKFSKTVQKKRGYDHDVEGLILNNVVIQSNYKNCLCSTCNLKKSPLRRDLIVLVHNLGSIAGKLMMKGLKAERFNVDVLTKSDEKYYSIRVSKKWGGKRQGVKLVDSINFMSGSLSDLCDEMIASGEEMSITKQALKNFPPQVTELCLRKGVYHYDYFDTFEKFEATSLPSKKDFFSTLRNEGISDEDYQYAQKVWEVGKCSNLGSFHDLYLTCDTAILADAFTRLRSSLKKSYKLDPINYVTLPSFAFDAALLESKVELELMHDPEMVTLLERSLRGGPTTADCNQFVANNKYISTYDPQMETKYIVYADYNTLYPSNMVHPLAHSKLRYLSVDEIEQFDLKQNPSVSIGYFIDCDFIIPPDVAERTNELPLGVNLMDITIQDQANYSRKRSNEVDENIKASRRLVATHLKKENYLTTLPLLQLYMELGAQVTSVNNVITFEQQPFLKSFVERNIELGKKSNSSFISNLYESLSNMCFEKSILNKRIESTKHRIVRTQAVFEKYCADPFLQRIIDIDDDYCVFVSASEDIVLDQPIHVGFQILENSKLQMYTLFHKVIKQNYGEKVRLLYSDTDSLILGFTGVDDIYHEMRSGALAPHMDLSNYKPESPFYDSSRKGAFGFLRDKMGGEMITEAICLLPKSFSLMTEDTVGGEHHVIACKGVPYRVQKKNKHQTYRDLLSRINK